MSSMMTHLRSSLEGIIDETNENSSDYKIAYYLLSNFYKRRKISAQEIADACFVSKAKVSRFCRKIGYEDYADLKDALFQAYLRGNHTKYSHYVNASDDIGLYLSEVEQCIEIIHSSISHRTVETIADYLHQYERVGILGKAQSQNVACDLQHDLLASKKITVAPTTPENQKSFIYNSGKNSLLMIISCSGNYFDDFIKQNTFDKENCPYRILITNNNNLQIAQAYDTTVVIPCPKVYAMQPLSLRIFCNMVAVKYNTKYNGE